MAIRITAFLLVFVLSISPGTAAATQCAFKSKPQVLKENPDALLQVWVEQNRPVLKSHTLPSGPFLREFRSAVRDIIDVDPVNMLQAQLPHVSGGDATNVQMVLNRKAGSIEAMNCLEALLLNMQIEQSAKQGKPLHSSPTEFFSFILARDTELKIYYYTTYQAGVRGLSIFNELLDQDISDGWLLVNNIHNHSIFPESDTRYGGVVPSATDIQYFRNVARQYALIGASITNGFNTIRISQNEFDMFSSEPYE
jgi:hypothetical protein